MKYRLIILATLAAALAVYLIYSTLHQNSAAVHYHAGFLVYADGVKQNFSDSKYMNFTPCTEHDRKLSNQEQQIEKAHLHDGVGDVVHVHRTGGTWSDLFENIAYALPTDKPVIGYVNGERDEDILKKLIIANESVIVIIGSTQGVNLDEYVALSHIKEVESQSELCGLSHPL